MEIDKTFTGFYVLTHEYFDKSAFRVCGLTGNYTVATAWSKAGCGDHKVYPVRVDQIEHFMDGIEPWEVQGRKP